VRAREFERECSERDGAFAVTGRGVQGRQYPRRCGDALSVAESTIRFERFAAVVECAARAAPNEAVQDAGLEEQLRR
jgi:hypothetical protein